jgi:hypothetical protein
MTATLRTNASARYPHAIEQLSWTYALSAEGDSRIAEKKVQ